MGTDIYVVNSNLETVRFVSQHFLYWQLFIIYHCPLRYVSYRKYEGHTESHEQRRIVDNSGTSNDWVSFGRRHQLLSYLWV